jgi:lipopolysaccharide export system permease protein
MFKILQVYIVKTILAATGLATLLITGVLFLMTLLTEFKNIGDGDYNITQALFYVFLRLPNQLYQFSPMLVLLGSIMGLSALSAHRELAVMRAAGFSIRQIIRSVTGAALIWIFLMALVGEWVAPHLSSRAEIRKENLQNAGQAVVTAAGVWFHVENNFIHVQHVVGRQLLEGVTRYQFDNDHHLKAAYYAKKLAYKDDRWLMTDVVKTSFYKDRTHSESSATAAWDLPLNANLLNMGLVEASEMSLTKLNRFANYLEANGLSATEYRYQFWQRIFQPFASLMMMLLAIPFVLGTFSRSTQGWRIIAGLLVGFAFFISNAFLGQISIVYQVPPMIAAGLPLLLFAGLALFLSRQLIRR